MKKLNLTIAALAIAALSGCSVTNVEKNTLKEPNGNVKINDMAVIGVVPVSYSYNTIDQDCSEIEFLKNVTGKRVNNVRVDNVYEIHWNHIENHNKILGISTPKQYSCNFWGLGIQYNVDGAAPAAAPAVRAAPAQQQAVRPAAAPVQQQPAARPAAAPLPAASTDNWN